MKSENIKVCLMPGGDRAAAERISSDLSVPLICGEDLPSESLTLTVDPSGVSLCGYGLSYRGDFEAMLKRTTGGKLPHEMLVHAAKTKKENPTAIDATAGMGEDSFLLAAAGYDVTLFEMNPVVAILLKDALRRAESDSRLRETVSRMHLIEGDSTRLMKALPPADLIYLDPMFPARRKSSLVGKKLQLIQHLEQPCVEEAALFEAARAANPGKIIIKRPLKGANLAGITPQYSIKGKAIRYDCFVLSK